MRYPVRLRVLALCLIGVLHSTSAEMTIAPDPKFQPSDYSVRTADQLQKSAQGETRALQHAPHTRRIDVSAGAAYYRNVQTRISPPPDADLSGNHMLQATTKTQSWLDWILGRLDKDEVLSFEVPEAKDPDVAKVDANAQDFLRDLANTYDQALAAIVFLNNKQEDKAKKILTRIQELHFVPGKSNLESNNVFSGEAIWVGLAAAHYKKTTGSNDFDELLKRMDSYIQRNQITDGSIRGGPDKPWASTEHNLDALAYLIMRHTQDPKAGFDKTAAKVAHWLVDSAYNPKEFRFNRGENDLVFATDTSSWGVLALSAVKSMAPDFFKDNKLDTIDLQKLMDAVENKAYLANQEVLVENTVQKISGYTFGSRISPISFEWSLGVAAAYRTLGNTEKADSILVELDKAQIKNSKGQISYPYASRAGKTFLDGWTATPFPALSSTAWRILVEQKINPFFLGATPNK